MASAITLEPPAHLRIPAAKVGRETILVIVSLSAVILAQMGVAGSFHLLGRNFWYDEILTYTLVVDPDLGHALRGLVNGVETHPPGLYVLLRGFTWLTGANEVSFRLFSLLSILAALGGIYALLRRSFAPLACCGALLTVWCHPLVVTQAFEARFYAPWLAGIVWFAYFLVRSREPAGRWPWNSLVAVAAVLVCTIHYFGIISLGLVIVGELLARRWAGVAVWRGIGFIIPGPLTLLACVPMLVRQRAAMTVPTWIEPAGMSWSYEFMIRLVFPSGLAAVAVLAWLARLVPWGQGVIPTKRESSNLSAQAGLTGLLLVPAVLVALSYVMQPVLQERYALPTVAGLAPVAACLLASMARPWQVVLCAVLCSNGVRAHQWYTERQRDHDERRTAGLIDDLRRKTGAEDLIFEKVTQLYVVCRYAPDLAGRCYLLDFESGQLDKVAQSRLFTRDLARRYEASYGMPRLKSWDTVRNQPHFYLVPDIGDGYPDKRAQEPYPGFVTRAVARELYEAVVVNE